MTMRRAALVAMAAAWSVAGAVPALAADGFDPLVGHWSCDGYFVKSGKKIVSTLNVSRDAATAALIVRHDDTAPNVYHAIEVWTSTEGAAPFRAAIANNGGMRWYTSDGWSTAPSSGAGQAKASPRSASPTRSTRRAIWWSIG